MTYNVREALEKAAARLCAGCDDTRRITLAVTAKARISSTMHEIESAADLGGDMDEFENVIRTLANAMSQCDQIVREINYRRRTEGLDPAEAEEE